jgi:hypothetical protein
MSQGKGSPGAGLLRIERASSGSGVTRTLTMAKTSTRPKPATSKKTEAAGSPMPDGAAYIQMIPLDQLEPSPLNVRRVAAKLARGNAITAQFVTHDDPKCAQTLHEFPQEPFGGVSISA